MLSHQVSRFACLITMVALAVLWPRCELQSAELVWIEAEHFDDHGGWTPDWQFIDQMGSPYLMAIGLGKPVADARTNVVLSRPGEYRLWVRTKDWLPEFHPGAFQLLLNGRAAGGLFGTSGQAGWRWEDGGVHRLDRQVEIRLRDMTGYYGRCDAVVLCDDPRWTPPDALPEVAQLRRQHGGVSNEVFIAGRYDVVVVGGGLAGSMAAVSSARMGARTALVQNRPLLGGNASTEILVPPVGVWPYGPQDPLDPKETGLVEEIRGRGVQTTAEAKPYSARLERLVRAEPDLDLFLCTHATGVEMQSPGAIAAVLALDVKTGRRLRFSGEVFIDCTGDAVIGVAAGAEYRHGREPRSMYDEPMAPETGDGHTMGNSLMYASEPTDSEEPFAAPSWAYRFPTCESFPPGRHPRFSPDIAWQWRIELGGTRDTYRDAEEIRDDLLRLVYGLWDHVKNHCDQHRRKAACHRLAWVGHVAGKRENRRLIGDYVLTEHDIAQQTAPADRVAYGGWGADDHHPGGFFHSGPQAAHAYKGVLFSIPFRCLYSRNVDNLLMAGRNISASHIALSDTRVMLTCAVIGQAAGTAAAMCAAEHVTPRTLQQTRIEQLQQQLLKDGAYLIDLPNRDPNDLARKAVAAATSERSADDGRPLAAENVTNGYARPNSAGVNLWAPAADDAQPSVELRWERPQRFNVVHVSFATGQHAARRFLLQAWHNGSWHELAEVADNRHRRHVLPFAPAETDRIRLLILQPGPAGTAVGEIRVYDEPPESLEAARRVLHLRSLPEPQGELPWNDRLLWGTGTDPR